MLGYFQLEFLQSWGAIFCPGHNCLIPASQLAKHLRKVHTEWTSGKKTEASENLALHITSSCGLDVRQVASDITNHLPDELDDPLLENEASRSLKCPKCTHWATYSHSGQPDRYLHRHMEEHRGTKAGAETGEPRWIYRIRIYPQAATHVFVLPEGWVPKNTGHCPDYNAALPPSDIPLLPVAPTESSSVIQPTQDWPVRLQWESYAAEIMARDHIKQLRTLIRLQRVGKAGPPITFLEKGLLYVRHFCIKYMKDSGAMVKTGIAHLGRVLVVG